MVEVKEIIDRAKNSQKNYLIFKVDFDKAYDSVNWNFLDNMMVRLGFYVK